MKPFPGMLGAMRIIESIEMTDTKEDWSRVRSIGRARRRMRKGYRQNISTIKVPRRDAYQFGNTLVMHPVLAAEMRRQIQGGTHE